MLYSKIRKEKNKMEKKITLTFIDNESHGYIKISKYDLEGFNIDIKDFSEHSYYSSDNACYYFEEDCDGSKLWNTLKNKGYDVKFKDEFVKSNYFDKPIFQRINT
jgi:hypothetical protein